MKIVVEVHVALETRGRWLVSVAKKETETLFAYEPDPGMFEITTSSDLPVPALRQHYDVFDVSAQLCRSRTESEVLAFLRRYGPPAIEHLGQVPSAPISYSDFQDLRLTHERWLLKEMVPVLSGVAGDAENGRAFITTLRQMTKPVMNLVMSNELEGYMTCRNFQEAVNTAAFLSHAEGVDWKRCGWVKCRAPFQARGKRTTFCSQKCAQNQAVRNHNERKAESPSSAM